MHCPLITLTTDFGLKDAYVAEMKAVILGISPNARIVDVTHQIEKFNVRMGAYVLAAASPYFPKDTVHMAVVDPDVGTERRPIILHTTKGCFLGPDNGLLTLAAKNVGGQMYIHRITNRKFMLPKVSNTFHGRDIFAPAAAHLAIGTPLAEFGPETTHIVTPSFASTTRKKDGISGEVVHIDDFGNIITNIQARELETTKAKGYLSVTFGHAKLTLRLRKAYGDVDKHQLLAVIGSHNFLEISVNQGSAADVLKVKRGDRIVLRYR